MKSSSFELVWPKVGWRLFSLTKTSTVSNPSHLELPGDIDLATCELLPRKIVVPMRHVQLQQRGFVQSREVRAGQALTVGCVDVHVAIMSQRRHIPAMQSMLGELRSTELLYNRGRRQ